ncbi:uncharacterized protein LOC127001915 [Eriocheir sinensis]|uniref:uncharacterized protein LOC127001915 n=1 Tax=Eriocheir sinensis TaxID=95602 RepID=UPI0021C84086|nr:uncharacterized protein LOC127001915 [Eriocheir sinensis]
MGDFNLPSISWNDVVPDHNTTACDTMFLNLFQTLGLHQWVLEPTFIKLGNILDLILTTEDDRIQDINIFPPFPNCGHALVKIAHLYQGEDTRDRVGAPLLDWARGKYGKICNALQQIDWDYELMHLDVDTANAFLSNTLIQLANQFIPIKRPRSKCPPWSKDIPRNLFKQRSKLWMEYKHLRQAHGRQSYLTLQKLFKFNETNAILWASALTTQINYEDRLIQLRSVKPKLFHSYIRNKKVDRPKVGPLMINGNLTDDPDCMADSFAKAFASVFVVESSNNVFPHQVCNGNISDVQFFPRDVESHLKTLNADSAVGPDGLHPRLLKECVLELAYPMAILFNMSMASGSLPQLWKLSHVSPIYKKGPHSDPLNYRPISLNPIPCKTMECIICKSLFGFIKDHLLFDKRQFGFRPNRSVSDQLLLTYDYVTYWYNQGHVVE